MIEYNVSQEGKTEQVIGSAEFIGSNLLKCLLHDEKNIKVF